VSRPTKQPNTVHGEKSGGKKENPQVGAFRGPRGGPLGWGGGPPTGPARGGTIFG